MHQLRVFFVYSLKHLMIAYILISLLAMQMAATNFGEAVTEVYEEDWTGRDTIIKSFSVCHFLYFSIFLLVSKY